MIEFVSHSTQIGRDEPVLEESGEPTLARGLVP
jgi:hypothetical protein